MRETTINNQYRRFDGLSSNSRHQGTFLYRHQCCPENSVWTVQKADYCWQKTICFFHLQLFYLSLWHKNSFIVNDSCRRSLEFTRETRFAAQNLYYWPQTTILIPQFFAWKKLKWQFLPTTSSLVTKIYVLLFKSRHLLINNGNGGQPFTYGFSRGLIYLFSTPTRESQWMNRK